MCKYITVYELVTDIILNITSQEDLMLTLLHTGIGSRLFELFSKEVRVNKQPRKAFKWSCCLVKFCCHEENNEIITPQKK